MTLLPTCATAFPPERLIAEAPIWGEMGYAFLPVVLHGQAATLMLDLTNEEDLTLSSVVLAKLGIILPEDVTLDSLRIGSVVEHHLAFHFGPDPSWIEPGPPHLPPIIGVMGRGFLTRYDVVYDAPAQRVRLYAIPAQPVDRRHMWLPPGIRSTGCGQMIHLPPGAGTFTGMTIQLDGHSVTGVFEMAPYVAKMNAAAVHALELSAHSPRIQPIPAGALPSEDYSHNGFAITQQITNVHLTVGQNTFWTGTVQIFPSLDIQEHLPPETPVMLMNLNTIRHVVLFNSNSSEQVCVSTP